MKVGQKLSVALLTLSVVTGTVTCWLQGNSLTNEFTVLQKEKAAKNLERSREEISSEVQHLSSQASDWANWDDTYKYAVDHNKAYSDTNLTPNMFNTTKIDLLFIVDAQRRVVFGTARLPNGKIIREVPGFPARELSFPAGEDPKPDRNEVAGVLNVEGVPLLVAGRPILTGEQKGPHHGTLFMGRFLSKPLIAAISKRVHVPFNIAEPTDRDRRLLAASGCFVSHPTADRNVLGMCFLSDPGGKPMFVLRTETVPDILTQGQTAVWSMLGVTLLVIVVTTLASIVLTRRIVVDPLHKLATEMEGTKLWPIPQSAFQMADRKDEVGFLARTFREMMGRLQAVQQQLLHASREAGMADVAKGVLHNAGNVLNSVTVSIYKLRQTSDTSKLGGLEKTVKLLDEHADRLPSFFADDEKARQVHEYLRALNKALVDEQRKRAQEINTLSDCARHLSQVVQAQHTFAHGSDQDVPFSLSDAAVQAVRLLEESFERHGVEIVTQVQEGIDITSDPGKLSQILVNLLTNAKDALKSNGLGNRFILLRLEREGNTAELRVEDNGPGIAEDDLDKVFRQGFSTKEEGTGFGLHYCANAANELGWKLTAESDGPGHGATFVLRIPLSAVGEQAA